MKFEKLIPWVLLIAALYFFGPYLLAALQRGTGGGPGASIAPAPTARGGLGFGGGRGGRRSGNRPQTMVEVYERARAKEDAALADEAEFFAELDAINAEWEQWGAEQRAQGLADAKARARYESGLRRD